MPAPLGTDIRVHHVAIAVRDIDAALGFFRTHFPFEAGVEKRRSFTGEFNWCNFYIGQFRVELIEGARPNSFVHRFIEKRGEGLHHLSFKVTQLERLVAQLETDGIRVVDRYTAADGSMTASISPRSAHGVLMQFWQTPPESEPHRSRVAPVRLRSGEIIHMQVDHVSVAVHSIDTALGFFRRYFPVGAVGKTTTGYDPSFRFTQFLLNDYKMEVITQNDRRPPGFVARFLQRRGEGFHHLSIDVDQLDPLLSQFETDGAQIVGRTETAGVGKTAFIAPRSAYGVLIQFWETSTFDGPSVFTGGQYRG